tara:strand:+ start:45 stop:245 length:201 start_codon:yes stop_codon:yes gene_type:complete
MANGLRDTEFDIVTTHHEGKKFPDCRCDTCYEKAYYDNGCNSYKISGKLEKKTWYYYIKKLFCIVS